MLELNSDPLVAEEVEEGRADVGVFAASQLKLLRFPTGISGSDLTQRGFVQAEKFGAQLNRGPTHDRRSRSRGILLFSEGKFLDRRNNVPRARYKPR